MINNEVAKTIGVQKEITGQRVNVLINFSTHRGSDPDTEKRNCLLFFTTPLRCRPNEHLHACAKEMFAVIGFPLVLLLYSRERVRFRVRRETANINRLLIMQPMQRLFLLPAFSSVKNSRRHRSLTLFLRSNVILIVQRIVMIAARKSNDRLGRRGKRRDVR